MALSISIVFSYSKYTCVRDIGLPEKPRILSYFTLRLYYFRYFLDSI